jgi:hypothetical protein
MPDKKFYQIIADELKTKNVDSALWIQAKATAEGDADKTEAIYIRLRYLDLKKSLLLPINSLSLVNDNKQVPEVKSQVSELTKLRSELAKKLLIQGKKSLYSTLKLHPDASDAVIAASIADLESSNLADSGISQAEFKYAKDTLSHADLREQYDRQLLISLYSIPKPYKSNYVEEASHGFSWWESRKTSIIIGVLSITLFGYLWINYQREHHGSEIQKEAVDVVKDAVHSNANTEQIRTQADIELKTRALSLTEERQRQDLELRNRAADQILYQQRTMQEALIQSDLQRQQAEQQRQQAQKEQFEKQAENNRIAREKQYYACMNQQLLSQRDVTNADASARCAMYR